MPIIKIVKTPIYTYAIWEIKESLSSLINTLKLTKNEKVHLSAISNLDRKKQSISAKLIFNQLANKKVEISYNKNGYPYCQNFKNISISHSGIFSIALISKKIIGIDIQKKSPKVESIKNKFLHNNELIYLTQNNLMKTLHMIWGAKESIYKTLNGLDCSFKKNIFITELKSHKAIGCYQSNTKKINYKINYVLFQDYFISIAKKIT